MKIKKIISFISAILIATGGVSFSDFNKKNMSAEALFDFSTGNWYTRVEGNMKIGYLSYGKICLGKETKYITIIECANGAVDIEIPSEIEGYPVTKIEDSGTLGTSFNNCADLKTLYIPDTVETIGNAAFFNCIALESVRLPQGITSISKGLFNNCKSLKTIDLPLSVSSIKENAFVNSGLENIMLSENVSSIEKNAFSNCNSLEKIVIKRPDCNIADGAITQGKIYGYPNSTAQTYAEKNGIEFEIIDDEEFEVAEDGFIYKRIDKNGDGVYDYMKIFAYNGNNENLEIKNEYGGLPVKEIGRKVFYCKKLNSVVIPDSIETIGNWAFWLCSASSINIPDSVKYIGEGAFYAMNNIESITIPDGLQEISDYMLGACENLKSVNIPESAKRIGQNAFVMDKNLTEINLNENLEYIDDLAFCDSGIKDIYIPKNVKEIGFVALNRTENINVDENNPYYKSVDGVLFTNDMKHLVQYPNKNERTEYDIPDGVVEIDKSAFIGNGTVEVVNMPETLKIIGHSNFERYVALKEVNFPESLEIIRAEAFGGCSKVESVTIPYNVRIIEEMFFDMTPITIYGYENSCAQDYAKGNFTSLGEYEGYSMGDISGDRFINASDASLLLQEYSLSSTGNDSIFCNEQTKYADINDDGFIDAKDASIILSYYSYASTGGEEKYIKNWYESQKDTE